MSQRTPILPFIQWSMLLFGIYLICLALAGCSEARSLPEPAPEPSVADQLRALGATFLWSGGIALGLGVILRVVAAVAGFGAFLGPAGAAIGWIARIGAPFIGLAAVGGALSIGVGAAFTWLADYLWAVVLACLAACLAGAVYYWPRIRAWLPARQAPV